MGSTDWISSFWISRRAVSLRRGSSRIPSLNGRCWAPVRLPPLAAWWPWPLCSCRIFTAPRIKAALFAAPSRTYRTLHTIRPPSHRSELSSTTSSNHENTSSTLATTKLHKLHNYIKLTISFRRTNNVITQGSNRINSSFKALQL